jgi:hypothetical protein
MSSHHKHDYSIFLDGSSVPLDGSFRSGAGIRIRNLNAINKSELRIAASVPSCSSSTAEAWAAYLALKKIPNGMTACISTDHDGLYKGLQAGNVKDIGDEGLAAGINNEIKRIKRNSLAFQIKETAKKSFPHLLARHGARMSEHNIVGAVFAFHTGADKNFGLGLGFIPEALMQLWDAVDSDHDLAAEFNEIASKPTEGAPEFSDEFPLVIGTSDAQDDLQKRLPIDPMAFEKLYRELCAAH